MVDPAIEWVADEEDIICGLTDLRMIQNPGVVDWTALMDATSEMKKIKKEGIEKDSPRGIVLITRAESKCRTACFKQMRKTKVDSIWKAISHPKKLPWDQTQAVIAIINNEKKKETVGKKRGNRSGRRA